MLTKQDGMLTKQDGMLTKQDGMLRGDGRQIQQGDAVLVEPAVDVVETQRYRCVERVDLGQDVRD